MYTPAIKEPESSHISEISCSVVLSSIVAKFSFKKNQQCTLIERNVMITKTRPSFLFTPKKANQIDAKSHR
mgnify:CR=1 FL=1